MRRFLFFLMIITIVLAIAMVMDDMTILAQSSFFAHEIPLATTLAAENVDALVANHDGEYLVVWQVDEGGGNFDIWARRAKISPHFHWLGDGFVVANSAKSEHAAAAAYNPLDDEFLVAYEFDYTEDDHDVMAQRVAGSADAATDLIGSAMPLGVTTGSERAPEVAFLSATGQYLVTYELDDDVWARRVARRQRGDDGGDFLGDEFPVAADAGSAEGQPAVAADEQSGYFLVTYAYAFNPDDDDVRGQRVRGAREADEDLLGASFPLAFSANKENAPALAYSTQAQAFIVLWQLSLPFNDDVQGAWVDANDFSADPVIGSAFDVAADLLAMEQSPAVAVDADTGDVAVALTYANVVGDWRRPALLWLDRDPTASPQRVGELRALTEGDYNALSPRLKLSPGSTHFLMGFTQQWGMSPDANQDAVLLDAARWGVAFPFVMR